MLRRVVQKFRGAVAWPLLRAFLFLIRPSDPWRLQMAVLTAQLAGFLFRWGLVWLALIKFLPELLPSASAVTTTAEVLPALMVSIFVFLLGSFFVLTQLGTTIHSNRASLLLLFDPRVQGAAVRTLSIAMATLLLALLLPADDVVRPEIAAFSLVLVGATAFALGSVAALLPSLVSIISAPRNFGLWVVEPVEMYLSGGWTDPVVWRAGTLCEMLKRGVRNGDSLQQTMALGAIHGMHTAYLKASSLNAAARVHTYEQGSVTGWLAGEIVPGLVNSGQEGLALDIANEDVNAIASAITEFGRRSAENGHSEEFLAAVRGLGQLATATQQVRFPGVIAHPAETVLGLGLLVQEAVQNRDDDAAAQALATWALAVAYCMRNLGGNAIAPRHPQWENSIARFGAAPFRAAHAVVDSQEFRRQWTNKPVNPELDLSTGRSRVVRRGGLEALHDFLDDAESEAP